MKQTHFRETKHETIMKQFQRNPYFTSNYEEFYETPRETNLKQKAKSLFHDLLFRETK